MAQRWMIGERYEIKDSAAALLGRGGMGDVYRGRDTQTGTPVAIKALKPEIISDNPEFVARFVREGEALRQLDHPNIVKMIAAVEEDDRHYLVMEYVDGGSLRDLLEKGPLPVPSVINIGLDLADALTRAHRLGIIHRDLKPANVLLTAEGAPRLTDFGVAHFTDSPRLTQTGLLIGTIDYLSPEACNGEPLDVCTDIWSFGVMLYEMLTGERPFQGETLTGTLTAILTHPVPDLAHHCPQAPDGLTDLVYRMLEKDRHQRIPSVRLVGAELEAVLVGRDTGTTPRSAPPSRFITPTPATDALRHNLPIPPTPFVGREAELTEVARLLLDPAVRLVTILSPGGMGKTRLALEAARNQLDHFEHGVYFVPLAPLRTGDAILPAMADALDLPLQDGANPRQQLLDYLQAKDMLLITDNFEHLLDSVELVTDILNHAPQIKILATSRVRLSVQHEHLFHLAGMDFPEWETPEDAARYSAVQLFLQSAHRVRPTFELTQDNLKYVSRICRLVQGMPLGILLAAAWVEVLSPEEVAAELTQGLDILESDLQDMPERHRSIRAVFDYSWDLLTEREQEIFQALSVFRGGLTREAAQEVTGASLRELMGLVNKSLLHRSPTGRYELHDLLSQYAAEQLSRSPDGGAEPRRRHGEYYLTLLERWAKDMKGPRQQVAWKEIEVESENARIAWYWAVENERVEWIDRAAEGFHYLHRYSWRVVEGDDALRDATDMLAQLDSAEALRVWTDISARYGLFRWALDDLEEANRLLQQSQQTLESPRLAHLDIRRERADVLRWIGDWALVRSNFQDAKTCFEQSLPLYRELGKQWGVSRVIDSLADIAWLSGDLDQAQNLFEESLALRKEAGDRRGMAESLNGLGRLARTRGDFDEQERLAREEYRLKQEMGDRFSSVEAMKNLGQVLILNAKFSEGYPLLEKSLLIWDDMGFRFHVAHSYSLMCFARMHQGQYEEAHTLGETGLQIFREINHLNGIGFALNTMISVKLARAAYAEADELLHECLDLYRRLDPAYGLIRALSLSGLLAHSQGHTAQVREHLLEALQLTLSIQAFNMLIYLLPAIALYLADSGEEERAVETYAAASRFQLVISSPWFEDVAGRYIDTIAASLPPEVAAAARERGRGCHLTEMMAELLEALKPRAGGERAS